MTLEDSIDALRKIKTVEIETEIESVIEETEEREDQDLRIKTERMIEERTEDLDHNRVIHHWKENS